MSLSKRMRQKIIVFEMSDFEPIAIRPGEAVANYQDEMGRQTTLCLDTAISVVVNAWLEANAPKRFNGIFGWDEILCMLLEESIQPLEDRQMEHIYLEVEALFPFVDSLLRQTLNPLKQYEFNNTRWIGRSCLLSVRVL